MKIGWALILCGGIAVATLAQTQTQPVERSRTPDIFGPPQTRPEVMLPPHDGTSRSIEYDPRLDIPSRLLPSDTQVSLLRSELSNPQLPEPGVKAAEWLTRRAEAVALVEVVGVDGFLSENESWVNSRLRTRLVSVLKNQATGALKEGDEFILEERGGTTNVGSIRVTAFEGDRRRMHVVGHHYLEFLNDDGAGGFLPVDPNKSFQMTGEQLRSLGSVNLLKDTAEAEIAVVRASIHLQGEDR